MASTPPAIRIDHWAGRLDSGSTQPLYQQIIALFERDLAEGRLSPGAMLPPLRELSEQLGVGMITVRRAIGALNEAGLIVSRRGSGSFVADGAAAIDAADRLAPGGSAAPSTQPLRVGVVFAALEEGYPFFRPMIEAIQEARSPDTRPIQLQLLQLDSDVTDPDEITQRLPLGECDALMMMSPVNPALIALCRRSGLAYVLLFNHLTDGTSRCISPDYHLGMLQAVEHLKSKGKRRLALVTPDEQRFSTGQLRHGFELAVRHHGLSVDSTQIIAAPYGQDGGYHAAERLLSRDEPADAIVFSSDYQACGGCLAAEEMGRHVPEQVAIIACGGALGEKAWPRELATIDLHLGEVGVLAARTLHQLIAHQNPPHFQMVPATFRSAETA